MFSNLLISYHSLSASDATIYDRCKLYFEKYICIKNTLRHNADILKNMKIKNKILKMQNKQLEKELDDILQCQKLVNTEPCAKYASDVDYEVISDTEKC
jgi:hypothetical protein